MKSKLLQQLEEAKEEDLITQRPFTDTKTRVIGLKQKLNSKNNFIDQLVYGFNSIVDIQNKFLLKQDLEAIPSNKSIPELKMEAEEDILKNIEIENVKTKNLIVQMSNNTKTIKNI